MLKRILYIAVFGMAASLQVSAQQQSLSQQAVARPGGKFGLGVVVGEPTGIAWKYWLDGTNALDGSAGVAPSDQLRFQVDYLWHSHPFNEKALALHYGPGLTFGFGQSHYSSNYFGDNGSGGFGVRGVIGVTYLIKNTPLDAFFELAPVLILAPSTGSGIDVGLGLRAYP